MKSSTAVILSALVSLLSATPLEKRQKPEQTVTFTDIVVVDVTVTVDGSAPTSIASDQHQQHVAYHANNGASKSVFSAQPVTSPAAGITPAQSSTSVTSARTPTSIVGLAGAASSPVVGSAQSPEQIQAAANAKQAAVNQKQVDVNNAQKASDFQHQNDMAQLQAGGSAAGAGQPQSQAQAPASSAQAPAPAASSPAQAAAQDAPATGNGGSCGQVGGVCSGDVTIYNDQGTGACGWKNDTNSEDFVALAQGMFGTYTNDAPGPHKNAFCGRSIAITVNGHLYNGMVTDRCGGCEGQSIDLSQHLFSQLYPNEPPGNGRYHDVQWKFVDNGPYHGPS